MRKDYFKIKIYDPESKTPNLRSLDDQIRRLEDEFRDQKGSGTFTSQNKFVKLLNLLTQLLTKNNSKKFKDDINQILKELYDSKQITKQVYQYFIKVTRKEQNKILDDKIKANNAQYNLDRMNAEISACSSGDLPKYEYLTKKDLGYKPDAVEQSKFEYSPLGKVFTDGLDKSDKNEGLLKRLKNIEDKSNNSLLTIKNISRPAIKGKNNSNVSDEYKIIQDFKQELIDKNILKLSGVKKFDNIVDKWKQPKNKKIVFKNVDAKVETRNFDIYKIFENYLNKRIDYDRIDMIEKSIKSGIKIYQKRSRTNKNKSIINNSNKVIKGIELLKSMIDNDEFKISKKYYAGRNNNVNLDWVNDKIGYEETAEEADSVYMKGKNDNELKLIKDFITKINNGSINNKNKAGKEFRKLKQNVTNDRLRQDLIKNLERFIFGEDIESIEPEEKYDESIAERVKIRKQNAPSSPPKKIILKKLLII